MDTKSSDVPVGATVRSVRIVDLLIESGPLGVSSIAERVEWPVTTVHSYLESLVETGWVHKDGTEYRASLKLFERGQALRRSHFVFGPARDQVDGLGEQLEENVHFVVREGDFGIVLYSRPGGKAPADGLSEGDITNLTSTAFGQAILSSVPREKVSAIVERRGFADYTPETLESEDKLVEKIDSIDDDPPESGYIADLHGEHKQGTRTVAAPVESGTYGAVGAIGVTGPFASMTGEYFESTLPELVREAANVIQLTLDEEG
jgi:DNA-binding IclR family transcriptional regulator